jgi:hypothetical protein
VSVRRVLTPVLGVVIALGLLVPVTGPPPASAAPPSTPTALAPHGGESVEGLLALSWERPAGATRYDVQLALAPDFADPLVNVTDTVNVRYVPTVQLPAGELWWRVRAGTGTGSGVEEGEWVTERFLLVDQAAPVLLRPDAGAVIQPPVVVPRFGWEPVPGATSYTVQVSPDPEFTDPTLISANTQKTTAAVLVSYQVAGTYWWRVRATLGGGYLSPWSAPRSYVARGLPPADLVAPADTFEPPITEVALDWTAVAGAATYQLQVSTDAAFLSVVHSVTGITGTRYSPPSTLDNDEYYWRVRSVDVSGNVAPWPDAPWRFRRAWPDQPELVYPRGTLDPDDPFFFEWTAVPWASAYTVQLWGPGTKYCSVTTVHTTLANGSCGPTTEGTYTWNVTGVDAGGNDAPLTDVISQEAGVFEYAPRTVGTSDGPLSVDQVHGHAASFSGTVALAGSTNDDLCDDELLDDTCANLGQTPVLTWDPVPGAKSYAVTIARDAELTNVVTDVSTMGPEPIWTAPPTKTLLDSQAGAAYFVLVQPCSGLTKTTCAPAQHSDLSFSKRTVAPALVSPVPGPDGTPPVLADGITLDWERQLDVLRQPSSAVGSALSTPASTEARSYVVETAIDPAFTQRIERVTVDQTTFTSYSNTYPEGLVYWRVQALDGAGNPSNWSATGSFEKRSPVPVTTSPASGGVLGSDYALSWQPLEFAAAYEVEVYAGPTKVGGHTSWKHVSWAPSEPLPVSSEGYTWRVRRVDAKGRKGGWSADRTFRIDGYELAAITPAVGAVVAPSTAYFAWDKDPRATTYRLERRRVGTTSLVDPVTTRATAWAPTAALGAGSWEWRVVALDAANSAAGASPWRPFAVVDPPAVVTPVSVTGSGKVGTVLEAFPPTFDPAVETVAYQWYRGTTPISGATGATYTVVQADLGKTVSVRATGTLTGYQPAVSSSVPLEGETGAALVALGPPTVVGSPAVGSTLTAGPAEWPETVRSRYQWFRDGVAISGATSASYRVQAADASRGLHVVETATVTGRDPATATSAPVRVARMAASVTLALSAKKATQRDRVTATVQVRVTGLSAPTGSVTVLDGSRRLKRVRLTSSTVTVRLPRLKVGKHRLTVTYDGSAEVAPARAKARLVVKRAS